MSGTTCYACGREARGSYCERCGAPQSETDQRHWSVMHAHERAARTAVEKARKDRELYGSDLPPVEVMVERVARAISDPDSRLLFPAVGAAGKDGLQAERVVERAKSLLDQE